jgi:hypothetical protein
VADIIARLDRFAGQFTASSHGKSPETIRNQAVPVLSCFALGKSRFPIVSVSSGVKAASRRRHGHCGRYRNPARIALSRGPVQHSILTRPPNSSIRKRQHETRQI